MIVDLITFKGYRCFKNEWAGFSTIKPINVIIGRNNTGKSHLLDLAEAICETNWAARKWKYNCNGVLDESSLRSVFREEASGGHLNGNHWREHGKLFVNIKVSWEIHENGNPEALIFPPGFNFKSPLSNASTEARKSKVIDVLKNAKHKLTGSIFKRLAADRDILPETSRNQLELGKDGRGASNIIRRYIVTSNSQFPREVIQRDLLAALNIVFGKDGRFTEIQIKVHDDAAQNSNESLWEIFLGEEKKGLVPLSNSGSGLKTIFLVLLNLLVIPEIAGKPKSSFVFAFEELENNLHPALLRRLLQYIENYAVSQRSTIFITTHSSTALDLFGLSKNAQIIHVTHDGAAAKATTVAAHFDHLGVISELGAKPSDLLQANGIIWVEGPSDCIYINRWLDLFTGGRLQEGRDYQCAFYGGSLLAQTQFKSPEEAEKELLNLLCVNPNIVVVCDGDRTAKGKRVKDRVRRIRSEVIKIPGAHIWVTAGREIENYIPGIVLSKAVELSNLPAPTQYEMFFPRKGSPGSSYVESRMKRKSIDKMDLAALSVSQMDKTMMLARFDWEKQMQLIVDCIDSWNQ